RISIDECLEHPWTTAQDISPNDSTDGLTSAIAQLDFSKRKIHRERTLLSAINDVKISRVIDIQSDSQPVKVYEKNKGNVSKMGKVIGQANGTTKGMAKTLKEDTPAEKRHPEEFAKTGGRGDQPLFGTDANSIYP
ncbi:hypothetical protein LTS18_014354, partial [Coniosporium uncinatum]